MDAVIELVPVLLFVAAFMMYDIFVATAVLMVAMSAQMAVCYFRQGRELKKMQLATWLLVLIFGGLTLVLRDQRFIQWKPTVLHLAVAVVLWGGLLFRHNFLHMLLGNALQMAEAAWRRLTWMWIAYMVLYAALNAYMVLAFSLKSWAYFKLWGYGVFAVFLVVQSVFVYRNATFPTDDESMAEIAGAEGGVKAAAEKSNDG